MQRNYSFNYSPPRKFAYKARDKIYLDVPYEEKEQAKTMGAKWDYRNKLWYVVENNAELLNLYYITPTCPSCNGIISKNLAISNTSHKEIFFKKYNIQLKFNQFFKSHSLADIEPFHQILAFATHAYGINLLYNPIVQGLYKTKKIKYNYKSRIKNDIKEMHLDPIDSYAFSTNLLSELRLHNDIEKIAESDDNQQLSTNICFNHKIIVELLNNSQDRCYPNKRSEYVVFPGNRSDRYIDIFGQDGLTIDEKSLLLIHRINLPKENPDCNQYLMSTWYLLFGCEAIRNPSMFACHNMIFDLIEAKKISWKEIMEYLPMAFSGSQNASNWLNYKFSKFMPHEYSYSNEEFRGDGESFEDLEQLLMTQGSLVCKWAKINGFLKNKLFDITALYKLLISDNIQSKWGIFAQKDLIESSSIPKAQNKRDNFSIHTKQTQDFNSSSDVEILEEIIILSSSDDSIDSSDTMLDEFCDFNNQEIIEMMSSSSDDSIDSSDTMLDEFCDFNNQEIVEIMSYSNDDTIGSSSFMQDTYE